TERGLFTACMDDFRRRRVAIGDGPTTERIGLPHSNLLKGAAEDVLYHRVLLWRDQGAVRSGRGDPVVDSREGPPGVAADPRVGQFDGCRLDVSAAEPRAVRVGRDLWGVTADNQQGHLGGHSLARTSAGTLRTRGRGAGARTAVPRGRDAASLLVMGRPPAAVLG